MGMAQKYIIVGRATPANCFAQCDDAGAGVEDQPAAGDIDLDAGSIATDGAGGRAGGGIAAAHAPKAHAKIVALRCHRRHVKQICRENKRIIR